MGIDDAIQLLGAAHVRQILNSGHAQDPGHPDGFRGHAACARIGGLDRHGSAYAALALAWEPDVRMACKSPKQLEDALLDGSHRAAIEMARRGILPQSAALQPAWL